MTQEIDIASRLDRLERLLDECRAPVAAEPSALLNITLLRIQRLTTEVQSSLEHRHLADDLDSVTIRLLLENYGAVVRQMRVSVTDAGRRLSAAAAVIADGKGLVREERKRRK